MAVALKYERMHRALSPGSIVDPDIEKTYLRSIAKKIIPSLVAESESSSAFLSVVLREILVNSILFPIVNSIADPDYLNQTIEILASKSKFVSFANNVYRLAKLFMTCKIRLTNSIANCLSRNMVKKLREALDRPFSPKTTESVNMYGSEKPRSFEEFLAGFKIAIMLLMQKESEII